MTQTEMCKEILERFLREWTSTGEEFLDKGLRIDDVREWLLIGEGVRLAKKAYKAAKHMEEGEEAHEAASHNPAMAYAAPAAPMAMPEYAAMPEHKPAAAPTRPVTA